MHRRCNQCGIREAIPLRWGSKFKLYRWWHGGRWAFMDGMWHQTDHKGYLIYPGHGVHYQFLGIELREDYRKGKMRYAVDE